MHSHYNQFKYHFNLAYVIKAFFLSGMWIFIFYSFYRADGSDLGHWFSFFFTLYFLMLISGETILAPLGTLLISDKDIQFKSIFFHYSWKLSDIDKVYLKHGFFGTSIIFDLHRSYRRTFKLKHWRILPDSKNSQPYNEKNESPLIAMINNIIPLLDFKDLEKNEERKSARYSYEHKKLVNRLLISPVKKVSLVIIGVLIIDVILFIYGVSHWTVLSSSIDNTLVISICLLLLTLMSYYLYKRRSELRAIAWLVGIASLPLWLFSSVFLTLQVFIFSNDIAIEYQLVGQTQITQKWQDSKYQFPAISFSGWSQNDFKYNTIGDQHIFKLKQKLGVILVSDGQIEQLVAKRRY